MPLLKPPAPDIPKRKYYVRIEEPLALKMEKYAEFLGAKTVDHVISQALDFVFRKDGDFTGWLAEHPAPAVNPHKRERAKGYGKLPDLAKATLRGSKPDGTAAALNAPGEIASAGGTI